MSMVTKHYGSIINNFAHSKNEGESFQDLSTGDHVGDKISREYVTESTDSIQILNDVNSGRAAEAYNDHF